MTAPSASLPRSVHADATSASLPPDLRTATIRIPGLRNAPRLAPFVRHETIHHTPRLSNDPWTGSSTHLFTLGLTATGDDVFLEDLFTQERFSEDSDAADRLVDRIQARLLALRPAHAPDDPAFYKDDTLTIARLEVTEFPAHKREASRASWYDWIGESYGGLGSNIEKALPAVLAHLNKEHVFPPVLSDGGLFWFKQLDVHPKFRGQRIGHLLLTHALWALHRSCQDLAMLEAAPVASFFADRAKPRYRRPEGAARARGVAALTRYYAAAGFTAVPAHVWPGEPDDAPLMLLAYDRHAINATGIGRLGVDGDDYVDDAWADDWEDEDWEDAD